MIDACPTPLCIGFLSRYPTYDAFLFSVSQPLSLLAQDAAAAAAAVSACNEPWLYN